MNKIQVVEQAIAKIEDNSTKRQMEAAKLLVNASSGDLRAKTMLQEGISSSDIPTVLEPAINVIFLAQYAAEQNVWDQIADEYQAPNFGMVNLKSTLLFRSPPPSSTKTSTASTVFAPACHGSRCVARETST